MHEREKITQKRGKNYYTPHQYTDTHIQYNTLQNSNTNSMEKHLYLIQNYISICFHTTDIVLHSFILLTTHIHATHTHTYENTDTFEHFLFGCFR